MKEDSHIKPGMCVDTKDIKDQAEWEAIIIALVESGAYELEGRSGVAEVSYATRWHCYEYVGVDGHIEDATIVHYASADSYDDYQLVTPDFILGRVSKVKSEVENNPWLTNTGKPPYAVGTLVDVIYRTGEINYGVSLGTHYGDSHTEGSTNKVAVNWVLEGDDWGIIHYRLHKSHTPELDPEAPTCRCYDGPGPIDIRESLSASILDTLKGNPSASIGEEENVVNVNTEASTGVNALGGKKFDHGKPRWSLLDFETLSDVVDVLELGAKKYGPSNFRNVEPIRYVDSTMRHWHSYLSGEEVDQESGKSHLHHMICGLMFLDYFRREGIEIVRHGDKADES